MPTVDALLAAYLAVEADPWEPDMAAGHALADLLEEQGHPSAPVVRAVTGAEVRLDRERSEMGYEDHLMILSWGDSWWVILEGFMDAGLQGGWVLAEGLSGDLKARMKHRYEACQLPSGIPADAEHGSVWPVPPEVQPYSFEVSFVDEDPLGHKHATLALAARLAGALVVLTVLTDEGNPAEVMARPIASVQQIAEAGPCPPAGETL